MARWVPDRLMAHSVLVAPMAHLELGALTARWVPDRLMAHWVPDRLTARSVLAVLMIHWVLDHLKVRWELAEVKPDRLLSRPLSNKSKSVTPHQQPRFSSVRSIVLVHFPRPTRFEAS